MNYVIENQFLRVEVDSFGAELQSVKGGKSGFEYLWQGSPDLWRNKATIIFPICGRLYNGKYYHDGKTFEMGLHGIARHYNFGLKEKFDDKITLVLKSTEQIKSDYPFDFELLVSYILSGNTVRTEFTVKNLSNTVMPFSVGGHPGFNVPFVDGENFEDYYVQFDNKTEFDYLLFTENKLCSGETAKLKTDNGKIALRHDLFDNDAIFMLDDENSVTLKSNKNNRSIKVSYKDMTHLGLWHTPLTKAPFVCIEPWHGSPAIDGKMENFYDKADMILLEVGGTKTIGFEIAITE